MSDKYILSFDLGLSCGVALGRYSETGPYSLVTGWQFEGSVEALVEWVNERAIIGDDNEIVAWDFDDDWYFDDVENLTTIAEKYTVRPNGGGGQSRASTMPLVCEGALIALGVMPGYVAGGDRWSEPANQYFVGGKSKSEKRTRLKNFLKATDNYRFGKELGSPDNEDFVSATAHGIHYVMSAQKHRPTFDMIKENTK